MNSEPTFDDGDSTTRSVAENSDAGANVGASVVATDTDGGDLLTYALSGTGSSNFAIGAGGQITVASGATLDHETTPSYSLSATVHDGKDADGNPDTSVDDTISVTINVTDVNEAPAVTGTTALDYAENETGAVATYTATDPEGETGFSWTLAGADSGDFSISNAGVLTFNASPNYEDPQDADTGNDYLVTIQASDGSLGGALAVTVNVTDVDEAGAVSLSPDQPQVGTALNATLTDPDGAASATTWTWARSADGSDGSWSSITGASSTDTTSAYTPVDDDVDNYLRATASYTDTHGAGKSVATVAVNQVQAAPVVNAQPTFDDGDSTTRSIAENSDAGANVGASVVATDTDGGDLLTYALSGTGSSNFAIGAGGQITVASGATLDHETTPSYSLSATVHDGKDADGNPDTSVDDTISVTINVTDVNEAPAVTGTTALDYAENETGAVATYTATDPEGETGFSWTLAGADRGDFSISAAGVLSFNSPPNYEDPQDADTGNDYLVTITAADSNSNSSSLDVVITVTNVDEAGAVSLSPDQPQVGTALNATLTDPDGAASATTWTWARSADGSDGSWSSITGASSTDTTSAYTPVDDDVDNYLRATASYTDPAGSGKGAQAVAVNRVQAAPVTNTAPDFGADTATRSIAENTAAATDLGAAVTATDADSTDPLTYSLSGTDAGSFDIVSTSGQLRTRAALDFETENSYEVVVTAADPSSATDSITVTITVTDVDEAPAVTGTTALDYAENETGAVATYAATDPEGETGFSWTLAGDDRGDFSISAAGVLSFNSPSNYEDPQDADTDNAYLVIVTAADSNSNSSSLDVVITVTNVDEAGAVSLSPDQPQVGTALNATLTDPDGAASATTWTWAKSADGSDGSWSSITGASSTDTTSAYTPVDDDVDNYLRATASYTDGEGPGKSAQAVAVNRVQAAPVTNTAPDFGADTATRSIAENTAAATDLGAAVTATDADSTDPLTYSLSGTDAGSFDIVSTSGQLRTRAALDFETENSYEVVVTAADPSSATDSITVTITVTDVNEAPAVTGTTALDYAENETGAVATYTATDPEGETGFSWTLAGDDRGDFSISAAGVLTFNSPPNYEDPQDADTDNAYLVTITAADSNSNSSSLDVVITVTNVDEAGAVSLSPDQPQVGSELTATLTDPDGAASATTWTWARSAGGSSNWGDIASATSASYTPVDGDVDHYLRATASYTDPAGSGKGAQAVSVNRVQAAPVVNSQPTFDDGDSTSRSIAENSDAGANVGAAVAATDAEGGDILTYALSGTGSSNFTIGAGGQITVASGATLDHETTPSYSLTATVHDGKDADGNADTSVDDSISVTINVTNVNEAPAVTGTTALNYAENGTDAVATYSAADPEGETGFSWTLAGDDRGDFSISAAGVLSFSASPNFEDPQDADTDNAYQVIVTAADSNSNSSSLDVTITVTNVDEAGAVSLSPDQPQVGTELTATLTDPDGAVSATTWTWAKSADGSDGSWSSITGASSTDTTSAYTPVDDDVDNYLRATASYTDGEGPGKSAQAVAVNRVQAAPVTNTAPDFGADTATRSIAENTAAATDIGLPVAATDADSTYTLTYSLSGTDQASFDIVSTSGQLQTRAALDYESKNSYEVVVTATDPSSATDSISVTDVDEAPELSGSTAVDYAENGTGAVATYTATDPEGETSFSWTLAGADSGLFSISNAGVLSFSASPNFEDPQDAAADNDYEVTITAADSNGNSSSLDVTVSVTDVDEAGALTLNSDQPQVGTELTATLADEDAGVSSTTWQWARSADGSSSWGNIAGATSASYTPVAADLNQYLRATATYTDTHGAGKSVAAVSVNQVQAAPVVNSEPTFDDGDSTTRSVAENSDAGANVGAAVAATDTDGGDVLTYALSGTGSSNFAIDANGQITVATGATLDHETTSSYSLTATVHDGKDADGNADTSTDDTITVTITVTNVDEPPAVTGMTALDYAENGTGAVATYTATDPEGETSFSWTLAGADSGLFSISTNGVLSFSASPNFEDPQDADTGNDYEVTITAADSNGNSSSLDVTVSVTDVDEAGALTLNSDQPQVGTELTATLADEDAGVSSTTWQWARSADGSSSWGNIAGATSASYTPVAADLNQYLRATATYDDTHGAGKSVAAVSVNQVQAAPVVNTAAATDIGLPVTATDADTLTYSLSGTDQASFDIVSTSGQLQTRAALDYESKNSYEVVVTATDPSSATDSITVTINVTDVNESPTATDDTVTTEEDQPVDINVVANDTDPDTGTTLAVTVVSTAPTSGTAVIQSGSATTVTYTPNADFNGTDTFEYILSDGSLTDTGTVTVVVYTPAPTPSGTQSAQGVPVGAVTNAVAPGGDVAVEFPQGASTGTPFQVRVDDAANQDCGNLPSGQIIVECSQVDLFKLDGTDWVGVTPFTSANLIISVSNTQDISVYRRDDPSDSWTSIPPCAGSTVECFTVSGGVVTIQNIPDFSQFAVLRPQPSSQVVAPTATATPPPTVIPPPTPGGGTATITRRRRGGSIVRATATPAPMVVATPAPTEMAVPPTYTPVPTSVTPTAVPPTPALRAVVQSTVAPPTPAPTPMEAIIAPTVAPAPTDTPAAVAAIPNTPVPASTTALPPVVETRGRLPAWLIVVIAAAVIIAGGLGFGAWRLLRPQ